MGRVLIDSVDIQSRYGAFIMNGGYAALLEYPSLKNIVTNDWMEQDGVDVDMTSARVAARAIQIPFGVKNNPKGFAKLLASRYTIMLTVEDFGSYGTYTLLFNGITNYSSTFDGSLTTMTVSFVDVDQTRYQTYSGADREASGTDSMTLSGINMSQYGWRTLKGKDGLWCEAARKPALLREVESVHNVITPMVAMGYAAKNISISGLMRAANAAEFFDNYYALYSLLKSGVLTLETGWDSNEYYKVIYTGGSFSDAIFRGSPWTLATLTFTVVGYE